MAAFPAEEIMKVHSFDGQTVWRDRTSPFFEVGNFLGGGAAGTVYECEHADSQQHFALKILNPLGFRLVAPALLRKCTVLYKGAVHKDAEKKEPLGLECVWWLMDGGTKQYIAAYYSERQNCLKDLTLTQCIEIWGHDPEGIREEDGDAEVVGELVEVVCPAGGGQQKALVPKIPPKYASFVRRRGRLFREIKNMRKISVHKNVIGLVSVLELNQESKCTIFLVMELANGGELFDRIKIDHGTRESTAKYFFLQLLEGVRHCHNQGVCHRDLKPENLLLQDTDQGTILKIADFGFSARFALGDSVGGYAGAGGGGDGSSGGSGDSREDWKQVDAMKLNAAAATRQQQNVISTGQTPVAPASYLDDYSPLKVLKSVVGSPFYVAPEVLQARGYDGPRADIWSLGVILYAMLAGNLPFGQELATCKRFRHFCKWVREQEKESTRFWERANLEFPPWLFPANFSPAAKGLIVSMLHPDPNCRLTIKEAMQHPLCAVEEEQEQEQDEQKQDDEQEQDEPFQEMHQTVVASQATVDPAVGSNSGSISRSDSDRDVDVVVDLMAVASVAESETGYHEDDDAYGVFTMEEDGDVDMESGSEAMRSGSDLAAMDTMSRQASTEAYEQGGGGMAAGTSPAYAPTAESLAFSPPPAPSMLASDASIDDLVIDSDEEDGSGGMNAPRRSPGGSERPPVFHDLVKKSTRFLTVVSAHEVLAKVSGVLEECREKRIPTPLGVIGRLQVDWSNFRMEVWGAELSGPPLFAMQLYEVPAHHAENYASSPAHSKLMAMAEAAQLASSFDDRRGSFGGGPNKTLYMVEFVREALDIFVFKRFYEWVRQSFSQLIKRDAGAKHML